MKDKNQCPDNGIQGLNNRVLWGDFLPTLPAFTPKTNVTNDRDEIIPLKIITACHTVGRNSDYTLVLRKPVDADIQEAAEDRSETKYYNEICVVDVLWHDVNKIKLNCDSV